MGKLGPHIRFVGLSAVSSHLLVRLLCRREVDLMLAVVCEPHTVYPGHEEEEIMPEL